MQHFRITPFFYLEICPLFLLIGIALIFNFNGLYGQDAHEYLSLCRKLNEFFETGKNFSSPWFPIFYPLAGLIVSKILRSDIIAMQVVSMISWVMAFHYFRKLMRQFFGEEKLTIPYSLLFFAFSPYILRFSLLSMSDSLCLWFLIAAYDHTFRTYKKFSPPNLIAASLYAGMAMASRYLVVIILALPLILLAISILKLPRKEWWWLFIFAVLIIIPLLPDYLITHRILFFRLDHGRLFFNYASDAYQWNPVNFFKASFSSTDGLQHYRQWNILFVFFNWFHPAYFFPGIFLRLFIRKEDFQKPEIRWLTVVVIGYAWYLAGLRYQNMRYLILTFPFILVILFPAFRRAIEFLKMKISFQIILFFVMIIQLSLFAYSSKPLYDLNHAEKEMAVTLKKFPGKTVYTCSVTGALRSYGVPNNIFDLYLEKIDRVEPSSLLLFNEAYFPPHFADKNPMINYNFIRSNYHLHALTNFSSGWTLYEIEN